MMTPWQWLRIMARITPRADTCLLRPVFAEPFALGTEAGDVAATDGKQLLVVSGLAQYLTFKTVPAPSGAVEFAIKTADPTLYDFAGRKPLTDVAAWVRMPKTLAGDEYAMGRIDDVYFNRRLFRAVRQVARYRPDELLTFGKNKHGMVIITGAGWRFVAMPMVEVSGREGLADPILSVSR